MKKKGITMAQWKILNRNSSFINPPRLPFCCEISGALLLAQPGLMAGRLSDEICVYLEIFKIRYNSKYLLYSLRLPEIQLCYCTTNAFKSGFSAKVLCKVGCRSAKNREAIVFLGDPYY